VGRPDRLASARPLRTRAAEAVRGHGVPGDLPLERAVLERRQEVP